MNTKSKVKLILIGVIVIALIAGGVLFFKKGNNVEISNNNNNNNQGDQKQEEIKNLSPISGIECENYNRRPFAIMLASDEITRPLSGVGVADLVVEMPVITNGITRLMAVFQCESPDEIGSVRSARHDFIPLALGLDAIYGHWGGSHYALDKLNAGIIDNIDALINPYSAYFRKLGIEAPHNGFTSTDAFLNAAKKLNYNLQNNFSGYPHSENAKAKIEQNGKLKIDYAVPVYFDYNHETNLYARWRNNKREIDKNNGNQVQASVVVVMRAQSTMIEPPSYNDVEVEGSGNATIYQNGEEIQATWEKKGAYSTSKLTFYGNDGKEIKFTPGKIWIEIVEPSQNITWELY